MAQQKLKVHKRDKGRKKTGEATGGESKPCLLGDSLTTVSPMFGVFKIERRSALIIGTARIPHRKSRPYTIYRVKYVWKKIEKIVSHSDINRP